MTISDKSINLGYWPKALVPQLAGGADHIAWGGLTFASPTGICPTMGFGTFPDGNYKHSGYFHLVSAIHEDDRPTLPYGVCDKIIDKPKFYGLNDRGVIGRDGHVLSYGGPGGEFFLMWAVLCVGLWAQSGSDTCPANIAGLTLKHTAATSASVPTDHELCVLYVPTSAREKTKNKR